MRIDEELTNLNLSFGLVEMHDQAKFPKNVGQWARYCKEKPTIREYSNWPIYKIDGVCLFTGALACIIDVDSKNWHRGGDFSYNFNEYLKAVIPFYERLVRYKTINGGLHYPYTCSDFGGNRKLACVDKETLIETREDGGLAVCPPTTGYEWMDGGEWEAVPNLTVDERDLMFSACRDFNEDVVVPDDIIIQEREYKENRGKAGDDWASQTDFIEWIKSHDWTVAHTDKSVVYLRRPGKDRGVSATWNYEGLGRFYCWSTSVLMPSEKLLKPFAVKAYLEHGGNFKDCARELKGKGFGSMVLSIVEAAETVRSWAELGKLLREHKEDIADMSVDQWQELKLEVLMHEIKGVSEAKLDRFKKEIRTISKDDGEDWQKGLLINEDNRSKSILHNARIALENDPKLNKLFHYDEFEQRIVIVDKKGNIHDYDDNYASMLRMNLSENYGDFSPKDIEDCVRSIAFNNKIHPLKDKILAVKWDGKPRINSWLVDYCGAEPTDYNNIVGKKWLVSAIARLMEPGCKVDAILVLEGGQGAKKSSLFRELSYGNFLDGLVDIKSRDGRMSLFGKWIVEFSELEGLSGQRAETVKAFLTQQEDKFRLPYDRKDQVFKRSCVFCATTNESHYLEDATGNRRYYPVAIKSVNLDSIKQNVDQMWAEALIEYRAGYEHWVEEGSEDAKILGLEQSKRVKHDEITDLIVDYLLDSAEAGVIYAKVVDIWQNCLGGKVANLDQRKQKELASILAKLGFKKVSTHVNNTRFKGWRGCSDLLEI